MNLWSSTPILLLAVAAGGCTTSERASADVTTGAEETSVDLDGVVVTVAPEDLTGEVIVIGGSEPTTSTVGAETDGGGIDSQEVAPEINPLGGDDPEDELMPDVLCMDLQDAQDEIQDHGVFFSKSVDATGQGRRQIIDRNWIVVDQSPAAGEPIGENEAVLSVVKDDEPSDC